MLPITTERHNPHSIATLRRQIATHLARSLPDTLAVCIHSYDTVVLVGTFNRLGLQTGAGNTWREGNIRSVRSYHQLPAYVAAQSERNIST